MIPPVCIPQKDPRAHERQALVEAQREQYAYTWHRPEGVASAVEVPKLDRFGAQTVIRFAGVKVALSAHDVVTAGERQVDGVRERRGTPEVCASYFAARKRTAFLEKYLEDPSLHDRLHAWQRVAGSNPLTIRRARALPDDFPVTQDHFARAVGDGDTLDAARADGRLYLGDWTALEGTPTAAAHGELKHLYGPWALYVQSRGGELLPVAIQCRPKPGADAPIYTPADGAAWEMAKLVVQCADTHVQALHFHVGRCHFLMEAFTLATMRRLPDRHPVKALLRPSMQYTLAINAAVRDELMVPGGNMDSLLAPTYPQCVELVRRSVTSFDLKTSLPPADVALRDVGDLTPYPWRDDALDVWRALRSFVGDYLGLYYDRDEDVRDDPELAAWTEDMRSPWGGRLDVPAPTDRAGLADLVAYVLYVAGPQHSVINYAQFDNMAFAPNMPTALYGPPPSPATGEDVDALHRLYLPEAAARLQYGFFYEQSQLHENTLGRYAADAFDDPRVAPVVGAFQRDLAEVEARIVERNRHRLVPFTCLLPSAIRASIHS